MNVELNTDPFLDDLEVAQRAPEVVDVVKEIVDRLVGLFNVPLEVFRIERSATGGADEVRFILHASDRFRELVSTLRAIEQEALVVKESGHDDLS